VTSDEPAPPTSHWFEAVAEHLGAAYLRYSFTKGTTQELDFLFEVLELAPGARVLDVGCGPGRHAHELARRGLVVVGVDISERFIELARRGAPDGATFERADARALRYDSEFDAAICLCQGAFGLQDGLREDEAVLAGIARALRPNGRLALTAFSAYFQVRYLEHSEFDAATGVNHEHTEVRDEHGRATLAELWTSCWTPKELRLVAARAGLVVDDIWSVDPGAYGRVAPDLEHAEFLLVAHRPALVA